MAAFSKGDRVAWHHDLAMHGEGSVIRESALPNDALLGTVLGPANDEKTWFEVELDRKPKSAPGYDAPLEAFSDKGFVVLTVDELVKVAPDA